MHQADEVVSVAEEGEEVALAVGAASGEEEGEEGVDLLVDVVCPLQSYFLSTKISTFLFCSLVWNPKAALLVEVEVVVELLAVVVEVEEVVEAVVVQEEGQTL